MQFYFMITYSLDAFAHSAESLSGYYFGAKRKKDFRRACFFSTVWSVVLALAISMVCFLFAEAFIGFMTISEDVRKTALEFRTWITLSPMFCVIAFVMDGIFVGITKIREMRNSMFFAGVLWLFVLYASYETLGYHSIWLAMSIFMISRAFFLGLCLFRVLKTFDQFLNLQILRSQHLST